MAGSDFEIEYLDEDEDVVQQCVQASEIVNASASVGFSSIPAFTYPSINMESEQSSLLVERTPVGRPPVKRKKRKDEDDSDYDPNDDYEPTPTRGRPRKKTTPVPLRRPPIPIYAKSRPVTMSKKDEMKFRRDLGVRIPNYEDPLCLPVKAVLKDDGDSRKLKNWNNVCLNYFRTHDTVLKPDTGETVGSQRTLVLRNVKNKLTGKTETTIWSKQTVHSDSDKKTEVFQCVLPKYRESKVLDFPMTLLKRSRSVKNVETAILTKEENKRDLMVVYKPNQALSAVYQLAEENSKDPQDPTKKEEDKKQYLQELTVSKLCASCYQCSWRGFKKTTKKKSVTCPICSRTFVSVYNLLAHVKTHYASDVQKYKRSLCRTLSNVVDYHYRCRICQMKCPSIKELRKHVSTHQSTESFQCEICNKSVKAPTVV